MTLTRFLFSSIGRKVVMALTGIALGGFVIGHLMGNLQIFVGQEAINHYGELLHSMPKMIWAVRLTLLTLLGIHILQGIQLWLSNRRARGTAYRCEKSIQATAASLFMIQSGLIIALFLVVHLLHFTFRSLNPEFAGLVDTKGRYDVYSMMVLGFQNPWFSTAYIFCLILLGWHLFHAIPSFFQTLGLQHPKYTPFVERGGRILAVLIILAYLSIPLSVLSGFVGLPGAAGTGLITGLWQ